MKRCLLCGWFNLPDPRRPAHQCHRCRLPLFDVEIKEEP